MLVGVLREQERVSSVVEEDDTIQSLQCMLEDLAKAHVKQLKALEATKAEKKSVDKKAKIVKVDKDITVIIDDDDSREKTKDDFMDDVLKITKDMDGFEHFHLKQYEQMLRNYERFLSEYLKGGKYVAKKAGYYSYSSAEKKEDVETQEVQMLTYDEKFDHVRKTVMNAVMGGISLSDNGSRGGSGSNHVDPNVSDSWYLWRIFQYNQIMSFFYTAQWRF